MIIALFKPNLENTRKNRLKLVDKTVYLVAVLEL